MAQGASGDGHRHVGQSGGGVPPPSSAGDSEPASATGSREPARVLPDLPDPPDQRPEGDAIGTVTADAAYDARRCHTAIIAREATAIIAIRKNRRLWKEDRPAARARTETRRATRPYGRAFRKRRTGYHARRRIEAALAGRA